MENREKWELMSNVYAIIASQFLLAVGLGSVVVSFSKIPHFVLHTAPGLSIYILSIVLYVIIECLLLDLRRKYPGDYTVFALWSILFASALGLSCSYSNGSGKAVLEALILIAVVAVVLAGYSNGAMSEERDFNWCELLSISILLVACLYIPIQIFHPFAKLSQSIYACLVAVAFSARMCIAATFFVNYEVREPISAAVICHLIFLLNNPNQKELTPSREY